MGLTEELRIAGQLTLPSQLRNFNEITVSP
jgi:hypothetical protein